MSTFKVSIAAGHFSVCVYVRVDVGEEPVSPPTKIVLDETLAVFIIVVVLPPSQPYSLLTLANNTCFRHSLSDVMERFYKLYKRKVG